MRRYVLVSGAFFTVLACAQLVRLLFRWPVQVAGVAVPLWASALAVAIAATLGVWAFRVASTSGGPRTLDDRAG